MANKIKVELRPYDACAIICFCRELTNEDNKANPQFAAIHEAIDSFEKQVYKQISFDQLIDALHECKINYVAGRQPKKN